MIAPTDQVRSLAARIDALGDLRGLMALPPTADLTPAQWRAVNGPLNALARALRERLTQAARAAAADRVESLGHLELAVADAFATFDTFVDVISQRAAPWLGTRLAGCDALARDALNRDDARLLALGAPIVYCDRGLGASILRQGVRGCGGARCPVALIQVPYARLLEPLALTSVLHEVGHQAMVALEVLPEFADVIASAAAPTTRARWRRWSGEIGADLWAFLAGGPAHAHATRELFALPAAVVLGDGGGVHPPPVVRVLLAHAWCDLAWPDARWRELAATWCAAYPPITGALEPLVAAAPAIARATLTAPLVALGGRPLMALFDLAALAPTALQRDAWAVRRDASALRALSPCRQLATLRELSSQVPPNHIDRLAARWLESLRPRPHRLTTHVTAPGELRWLI